MTLRSMPRSTPTSRRALAEDVGTGDLTGELVPADATRRCAPHRARSGGAVRRPVVRGRDAPGGSAPARRLAGARRRSAWQPDTTVCELHGPARAPADRRAQRAELPAAAVRRGDRDAALSSMRSPTCAAAGRAILDTRKTLPGLRLAQKYAVRVGGGTNQRLALYDGILIKENHIAAAGGVAAAMRAPPQGRGVPMQIEVETLEQLRRGARRRRHVRSCSTTSPRGDALSRGAAHRAAVRCWKSPAASSLDTVRAHCGDRRRPDLDRRLTKDVRATDLLDAGGLIQPAVARVRPRGRLAARPLTPALSRRDEGEVRGKLRRRLSPWLPPAPAAGASACRAQAARRHHGGQRLLQRGGPVQRVVQAAALVARQRAGDDRGPRRRRDCAARAGRALTSEVGVVLVDLVAQQLDAPLARAPAAWSVRTMPT